jgi:hypothetical protein
LCALHAALRGIEAARQQAHSQAFLKRSPNARHPGSRGYFSGRANKTTRFSRASRRGRRTSLRCPIPAPGLVPCQPPPARGRLRRKTLTPDWEAKELRRFPQPFAAVRIFPAAPT